MRCTVTIWEKTLYFIFNTSGPTESTILHFLLIWIRHINGIFNKYFQKKDVHNGTVHYNMIYSTSNLHILVIIHPSFNIIFTVFYKNMPAFLQHDCPPFGRTFWIFTLFSDCLSDCHYPCAALICFLSFFLCYPFLTHSLFKCLLFVPLLFLSWTALWRAFWFHGTTTCPIVHCLKQGFLGPFGILGILPTRPITSTDHRPWEDLFYTLRRGPGNPFCMKQIKISWDGILEQPF
jgi:hypothetical protein